MEEHKMGNGCNSSDSNINNEWHAIDLNADTLDNFDISELAS